MTCEIGVDAECASTVALVPFGDHAAGVTRSDGGVGSTVADSDDCKRALLANALCRL